MRMTYRVVMSALVGALVNLHCGGYCLGIGVALGLLLICQECARK